MNDLRKAAEMALEALMQRGEHHPKVYEAAEALRQALDDKPPVKTYAGGKPNYCIPLQSDRIRIDPVTGDVGIGTVDAVNMSEERVDETAKGEHEPTVKWDASAPLVLDCPRCGHCGRQREWVGLTVKEARKFYEKYTNREELIYAIDEFLEEKNT